MNNNYLIANELKRRFQNLLGEKWSCKLSEIIGCSDEEIGLIESKYSIVLPESYKVFLLEFGKTSKQFLNDLEMAYPYPLELTETLYKDIITPCDGYIPPTNIPMNMFVFASYLYDNFWFFFTDNLTDNPPIYLSNASQGGGNPFEYEKVGDSVWGILEESIKDYEEGKKKGHFFVSN